MFVKSEESIHDEVLRITSEYKKSESELISIIQKIDDLKAFREKGFTSCYEYCVKFLKLSDVTTYDFINVARKSKAVPELKKAIDQNLITVSKARRLAPVITSQNSAHWISLAQNLSKEKLEKEIAQINPKAATPEKIKYVAAERLKLELGVSEEFMKMLKRAQDIMSQKMKSNASYEVTLEQALKEFLDRNDPVKKAERALGKVKETDQLQQTNLRQTKLGPGQVASKSKNLEISSKNQVLSQIQIPFQRSPLSARLKHQVNLRDQAQCAHINPTGQRCLEKKWLQIHHKTPICHGGQNDLSNLKTLCSAHHQIKHLSRDTKDKGQSSSLF